MNRILLGTMLLGLLGNPSYSSPLESIATLDRVLLLNPDSLNAEPIQRAAPLALQRLIDARKRLNETFRSEGEVGHRYWFFITWYAHVKNPVGWARYDIYHRNALRSLNRSIDNFRDFQIKLEPNHVGVCSRQNDINGHALLGLGKTLTICERTLSKKPLEIAGVIAHEFAHLKLMFPHSYDEGAPFYDDMIKNFHTLPQNADWLGEVVERGALGVYDFDFWRYYARVSPYIKDYIQAPFETLTPTGFREYFQLED